MNTGVASDSMSVVGPDAGDGSRLPQADAVDMFLASASVTPSGLLVEGDAGIGKTTLWLAAMEQAKSCGFQVLSARAAVAESVLAYAALADLLSAVDPTYWEDLPGPQRLAIDRALLRADLHGPATDQRAVAAGLLSVIKSLADQAPVLLAIDDLQWLDPSSAQVVAFAARRLSGRTGVLATVRTDPNSGSSASWLQLPTPDALRHIGVPPLSLGALHSVIVERLGRSLTRPTMVRIHEASGGNPFYALELARAIDARPTCEELVLPGTLVELMRARIGSLAAGVDDALLAAACVNGPTVELVAAATGCNTQEVARLLADAEDQGIVGIDGHQVRFAHPLLARSVYNVATPTQRRGMHRRLAGIVTEPELQARHLALAAVSADPPTLQSLDAAAEIARIRGAPGAAAELLDMAIRLGGDTPSRRIRAASHHFGSGDTWRARKILEETIEQLAPGPLRAEALNLLAVVCLNADSFGEAEELLKRALREVGDHRALQAQMLITLSYALFNAGHLDDGVRSVEDAVTNAAGLGEPQLLSQALSMRATLRFIRGDGIDESGLRRAMELEDHDAEIPVVCRPSYHNAVLLAWTGQFERASQQLLSIWRRCSERGEEGDLSLVTFHVVLLNIWRGRFADATVVAEDAMERALQLGGDLPLLIAHTNRAAVAAYAGREHEVRCEVAEALAASQRCTSYRMGEWPLTHLGFLEVSLGRYDDALVTFQPLLSHLNAAPDGIEIIAAGFLPDALEAMIARGRLDDAEPLIERLERHGGRLDRPWMLAVGARCRAMLLAARGDLDAAEAAAMRAMTEHDRLTMPFERARSQLVLGQLQRRQRHKGAAAATLGEALAVFEDLDTPLWAERARAELARATLDPSRTAELTTSEQRVAELAASGMSNRDIAAAMFISTKTVEANLSRIYRKLDIHSRAELKYISHMAG